MEAEDREIRAALQRIADDACLVFLGWKLREDRRALLALEEGHLEVDLRSAETRCDGDPLPPLFIAGELKDWLVRELEAAGLEPHALTRADVDASFAKDRAKGRSVALKMACQVRLECAGIAVTAQRNNH